MTGHVLTPLCNPGEEVEPKGSPHLKDVGTDSETERRLSCQAAQPPSRPAERRVSGLPGLPHELQGAEVPPRVQTPVLPSPGKPISRRLQGGSTPDDKSQSNPPRLSHPRSHRRAWGWGLGRRRVPAETPGRAFPSHALRSGHGRLSAGGEGSIVTTGTHRAGTWGRAVEGPRVGRGRGPGGGGARRVRPARASLLLGSPKQ